ncbi:MAG: hypothetical protein U0R71_13475 [Solirubrobacterales bacterium]
MALAAAACAVVLGWGAATSSAAVIPVEGPWHATTSQGLPVRFEVTAGQVVEPNFRLRWDFNCGVIEAKPVAPGRIEVPIEPNGQWRWSGYAGAGIEATFVAPDRAEGRVFVPERLTPACLAAGARFVAEPGTAPFEGEEVEAKVCSNVRGCPLVHAPKRMVLKRDGSFRFYGLRWKRFGQGKANATGRAYIRRGNAVFRPRARVTLSDLEEQPAGGGEQFYLRLSYVLRGPVPAGFQRRGGRPLPGLF